MDNTNTIESVVEDEPMTREEIRELTGEDPADMFGEGGFEELQEERIPTMAEVGYIPKKYREEADTKCGKFHKHGEETCIECKIISLGI